MDRIPDDVAAEHEAQLSLLASSLGQVGHDTHLLAAGDALPVPTLLVALDPDEEERDRTLAISLMPLGDGGLEATDLVQFYVRLPFAVPADRREQLQAATAIVNTAAVVGHFAVRDDELYYRYVLATANDAALDAPMIVELIRLLAFHQERFGDYLEGVVDDEIALEVLPQVIAQTS